MVDSDQIMVDSAQIDACLHAPFTRGSRVFTRPFHASGTRVFNFEFRVKGKGRERKEGKGIKEPPERREGGRGSRFGRAQKAAPIHLPPKKYCNGDSSAFAPFPHSPSQNS